MTSRGALDALHHTGVRDGERVWLSAAALHRPAMSGHV